MGKTARLECRVEPGFKLRVDARARELGQKTTTFVERALEQALSGAALVRSPSDERALGALLSRGAASPAASVRAPVEKEPDGLAVVEDKLVVEGVPRLKAATREALGLSQTWARPTR